MVSLGKRKPWERLDALGYDRVAHDAKCRAEHRDPKVIRRVAHECLRWQDLVAQCEFLGARLTDQAPKGQFHFEKSEKKKEVAVDVDVGSG